MKIIRRFNNFFISYDLIEFFELLLFFNCIDDELSTSKRERRYKLISNVDVDFN